jgi:hypothetical protein
MNPNEEAPALVGLEPSNGPRPIEREHFPSDASTAGHEFRFQPVTYCGGDLPGLVIEYDWEQIRDLIYEGRGA